MKYWAYVNNEILGPFEKEQLRGLPAFSPSLLVCPQTPVGEKTEDWKEASVYPELVPAAAGEPGPAQAAEAREPVREAAPSPAPAAGAAIETPQPGFKPLGDAKQVEPVPPSSHLADYGNISISHFSKQGETEKPAEAAPKAGEPAPEPAQSASSFEPISLSQIVKRTETVSPQEPQKAPDEGLALEPRPAAMPQQPEPAPAAQEPAQSAPEPAQQIAAGPVTDLAGLESLVQKLDALSRNAATKKDIESAMDPFRFKLDQMGEAITSIKNSRFQKDVIEKLAYLESAVAELKISAKTAGAAPPAPATESQVSLDSNRFRMEKSQPTVFGARPEAAEKAAEPPRKEPAKEPEEIKDLGSKKSNLGTAVKKVFRLIFTLALLAAVLAVAAIGLKNFGVFDVTPFLPFPVPFISGTPSEQPGTLEEAAGQPETPQEQPPADAAAGQPSEAAPRETGKEDPEELRRIMEEKVRNAQAFTPTPVSPEVVPEVIYITRTFKLRNSAETLENKIYAHASRSGGNASSPNWEVVSAQDGRVRVTAVIPAKDKNLLYPFLVDRSKKAVEPDSAEAREAYDAMAADKVRRPGKAAKKKAAAKPAAKPAPKPAAQPEEKKPAVLKPEQEDDAEYEYVYVDEDGYEEPAGK